MGRRTLTIVDVIAILAHWHAGQSQSEIAAALRLDRKTVRKYLRPARAMGLYPDRTSLSPEEWARLVRTWFPELADARLRQVTWPEIGRHRAEIEAMLGEVAVATIWRRLREEHGLACSVASFRRYVRTVQAEIDCSAVPAGPEMGNYVIPADPPKPNWPLDSSANCRLRLRKGTWGCKPPPPPGVRLGGDATRVSVIAPVVAITLFRNRP